MLTYNKVAEFKMQRAGWIDVFYIVGSRKHVIGTFCTIGRREHIDLIFANNNSTFHSIII
jgi:hypothetical protein